jgi:hypothetical protein
MEVDGVLGDQTFEQSAEDVALGDSGNEVGIEFRDLVTDAPMEDLGAVAALNGGFAFEAAGVEQKPEA